MDETIVRLNILSSFIMHAKLHNNYRCYVSEFIYHYVLKSKNIAWFKLFIKNWICLDPICLREEWLIGNDQWWPHLCSYNYIQIFKRVGWVLFVYFYFWLACNFKWTVQLFLVVINSHFMIVQIALPSGLKTNYIFLDRYYLYDWEVPY